VQRVITPDESARLDAAASDPVEVLMDRAGFAVAVAAARMGAGYGRRVIVLCGPGNNGGDGYVAARYLKARGADVEIRSLAYPKDENSPARRAASAAVSAGVRVKPLEGPEPADLVIDALFGAGFHGELPPAVAMWTEAGHRVLAVDVPSGLDAASGDCHGSCFAAERTVTFHALKVGHLLGEGPDRSGEIEVVDIGLDGGDAALWLADESDAPRPARVRTSHKWSVGSVLVVGGSPGISGAAMLAARAALNSGAGSVKLACPGGLQAVYSAMSAMVMTEGIGAGDRFDGSDAPTVAEVGERFDVMALGPGLGRDQDKFVAALLEQWPGPLVLDADGLNALSGLRQLEDRDAPTIITPHHGEFSRLTDSEATLAAARRFAKDTGTVLLLKGNPTLVLGEERWAVTSGGPELATIGTGDVLTGSVAALWARDLDPETAARSGAYWHGRAGQSLAGRAAVTAEGLVEEIGRWL
jgi:NAD(P)H-hydrate epimerase